MPPQKGTDQDALVPVGTFISFKEAYGVRGARRNASTGWLVMPNGCHIWQGAAYGNGRGYVCVDGRRTTAYRARYELEVGLVPDGLVLDHFACDNGMCCNPAHVRPVTYRENALRSDSASALHRAKTHCPRGHSYSGKNLRVCRGTHAGARVCRTCHRTRQNARYHASRARVEAIQ